MTMPKIPDCDRCSLYAHNPHLICAVHPDGVETDKCLDFRPDPNAHIEEKWSPQGYSWCAIRCSETYINRGIEHISKVIHSG